MSCKIAMYKKRTAPKRLVAAAQARFSTVCKRGIRAVWGKRRFGLATHIALAFKTSDGLRSKKKRISICGFALVQKKDKYLYLDVLCSHMRYGSKLLARVEDLARKLKLTQVRLKALKPVIGYYKKKGYRHVMDGCGNRKEKIVGSRVHGFRMSKCIRN